MQHEVPFRDTKNLAWVTAQTHPSLDVDRAVVVTVMHAIASWTEYRVSVCGIKAVKVLRACSRGLIMPVHGCGFCKGTWPSVKVLLLISLRLEHSRFFTLQLHTSSEWASLTCGVEGFHLTSPFPWHPSNILLVLSLIRLLRTVWTPQRRQWWKQWSRNILIRLLYASQNVLSFALSHLQWKRRHGPLDLCWAVISMALCGGMFFQDHDLSRMSV